MGTVVISVTNGNETMSGEPDIHHLAQQFAVLEERMNTMQAEYRTDIARLAEASPSAAGIRKGADEAGTGGYRVFLYPS